MAVEGEERRVGAEATLFDAVAVAAVQDYYQPLVAEVAAGDHEVAELLDFQTGEEGDSFLVAEEGS